MTTVNVVDSYGAPVDKSYTIITGSFSQGTIDYYDNIGYASAQATGGTGGSTTPYTLESASPFFTVGGDGRLPFFNIRAIVWLRTTNQTATANLGGTGSMSAEATVEIPGIMSCTYSATISTTDFRQATGSYPYPYAPSTKTSSFSLTFMGATASRTDVDIGGANGWFPVELYGLAPIELNIYYPLFYADYFPPKAYAALSYPADHSKQLEWQSTYAWGAQLSSSLDLGSGDGVSYVMTATPGDYYLQVSAQHYQTAANATQITSGATFAEIVEIASFSYIPTPPAPPPMGVRGVSIETCGDALPCEEPVALPAGDWF